MSNLSNALSRFYRVFGASANRSEEIDPRIIGRMEALSDAAARALPARRMF